MPPERPNEDLLREALKAGQKERTLNLRPQSGAEVFEQFFGIKLPNSTDTANVRPIRPEVLGNGFNLTPDPRRLALLDTGLGTGLDGATLMIPAILEEQTPRAERAERAIRDNVLLAFFADEALMTEDTRTGMRTTRLHEIERLYEANVGNVPLAQICKMARLTRKVDNLRDSSIAPAVAAVFLGGTRGLNDLLGGKEHATRSAILSSIEKETENMRKVFDIINPLTFKPGLGDSLSDEGTSEFIHAILEGTQLEEERKQDVINYLKGNYEKPIGSKKDCIDAIFEAMICTSFNDSYERLRAISNFCIEVDKDVRLGPSVRPLLEASDKALDAIESLLLKAVRLTPDPSSPRIIGMPAIKTDGTPTVIGQEELRQFFARVNSVANHRLTRSGFGKIYWRAKLPATIKRDNNKPEDLAEIYYESAGKRLFGLFDATKAAREKTIGEAKGNEIERATVKKHEKRRLNLQHGLIAGMAVDLFMQAMRTEFRDYERLYSVLFDGRGNQVYDTDKARDLLFGNQTYYHTMRKLGRLNKILPFLRGERLIMSHLFAKPSFDTREKGRNRK